MPTPLPTPTSTSVPTPIPTFAAGSASLYVYGWGSDGNDCRSPAAPCQTIGHALSLAHPGDTISIAAGTYTEHLAIAQDVTLLGAGAGQTIIDGQSATTPGSVVRITSGTMTIAQSTIRGNMDDSYRGGITNHGTLTITGSLIDKNGGAGIVNAAGSLWLVDSTLSNNDAGWGPYGGLTAEGGTVTVLNSTISGNDSQQGTGMGAGIANTGASVRLGHTIVAGNTAVNGSGIVVSYYDCSGIVVSYYDCSGTLTSWGYNLIGTTVYWQNRSPPCQGLVNGVNGDQVGTGGQQPLDPHLGPLQDNGGPTWTMALLPGSPAIDAGNPAGCTDERPRLLRRIVGTQSLRRNAVAVQGRG